MPGQRRKETRGVGKSFLASLPPHTAKESLNSSSFPPSLSPPFLFPFLTSYRQLSRLGTMAAEFFPTEKRDKKLQQKNFHFQAFCFFLQFF